MKEKIKCGPVYDAIIIGGGPAGITAGIYLARRKLCVLILYEQMGGQASLTSDIENYAGFKFITGEDFTKRLKEHLNDYDIRSVEEKVLGLNKSRKNFKVKTDKQIYEAKSKSV